jgi:hypothetical protein
LGIFFTNKAEQPIASSAPNKLEIKHRREAVRYARDLRDEINKLAPTIEFFDEVGGGNAFALVDSLERCIEMLESGNIDQTILGFRFPKNFYVVVRSILAVGATKEPLFNSITEIPAFIELQHKKRQEEEQSAILASKREAQEKAAQLEAERIRNQQLETASKLGISPETLSRLQNGDI